MGVTVSCRGEKEQNDVFLLSFYKNCQKCLHISINLFTFAPERKS